MSGRPPISFASPEVLRAPVDQLAPSPYPFLHSCGVLTMWEDRSAMVPVSHFDLMMLFTVAACIHAGGIVFAIWVGFKITSMVSKSHEMLAECQRLTKAVGALVIQEEDKTRQLFPR